MTIVAQISGSSSAKNIMVKSNRASKSLLSARITLDGCYQTGNTEKANVAGAVFLSAIDSIKEFSANTRFLYGSNDKTVNQREFIAGLQYDYHPLMIFSPFARFEYYNNEFQKIKGRFSGLVGIKYRYFVKPQILDYSISMALIYDVERYEVDVNLPYKERLRISVRPKFKHNLADNIFLIAEVYYKPNILRFDDFIVCGNVNMNYRFFKRGLFRLSYEYDYNNKPVTDGVRKTDSMLLAGLGIEF